MFIGTPGRHLRPLSLPNGTPWHYRATLSPIIVAQRCWPDIFTHFTNPSLTQKPRLFSTSLQARTLRRHLSLLSSPNGVHRHYRATLTPIIVAQGYWPDIFTHFTNPSLTQKPRLFSTSLQARTLRRHLSLLSSPNGVHRHYRATLTPIIVAQRYSLALPGDTFRPLLSPNDVHRHYRATLKPIIVAQRYSLALPGDTFVHYCRPTVLLGTTGRHFRPLLSPNGAGLTYSLTSQIPPSLKSLDSSPPPFKPALSCDT